MRLLAARFKEPTIVTWVVLVTATTLAWWLGEGFGDPKLATVAIFSVAFFKVYLVGQHFMELRHAPLPLRLVFGGWCAAVCTLLVAIYLFAG